MNTHDDLAIDLAIRAVSCEACPDGPVRIEDIEARFRELVAAKPVDPTYIVPPSSLLPRGEK